MYVNYFYPNFNNMKLIFINIQPNNAYRLLKYRMSELQ